MSLYGWTLLNRRPRHLSLGCTLELKGLVISVLRCRCGDVPMTVSGEFGKISKLDQKCSASYPSTLSSSDVKIWYRWWSKGPIFVKTWYLEHRNSHRYLLCYTVIYKHWTLNSKNNVGLESRAVCILYIFWPLWLMLRTNLGSHTHW